MTKILELLFSFLMIGLFSIGGGYATIPLIQEQIVTNKGWLNPQEFTDIITISQMTPGPLAVNSSTFVGTRVAGLPGAIIATFGCVISGFIISLMMYRFFTVYKNNQVIAKVLSNLKAGSTGLIAGAAATILCMALLGTQTLWEGGLSPDISAVLLFGISLFAIRKYKLNPTLAMVFTGVIGIFIYQ